MFTFWIGDGRTACENITTLAKELGADCSNLAKRVMGTDGAAVCRVLEADAADLDGRHGEGMLYGKCIVWFGNSVLICAEFREPCEEAWGGRRQSSEPHHKHKRVKCAIKWVNRLWQYCKVIGLYFVLGSHVTRNEVVDMRDSAIWCLLMRTLRGMLQSSFLGGKRMLFLCPVVSLGH